MDDSAKANWVLADVNGLLEDDLLCLSHCDTVTDRVGRTVVLQAGLTLTAFDYDANEHGRPDDISPLASSSRRLTSRDAPARGGRSGSTPLGSATCRTSIPTRRHRDLRVGPPSPRAVIATCGLTFVGADERSLVAASPQW
jgi:hypothetical protein